MSKAEGMMTKSAALFPLGFHPLNGAGMLLQPQGAALTWIQPVLTSYGVQGHIG